MTLSQIKTCFQHVIRFNKTVKNITANVVDISNSSMRLTINSRTGLLNCRLSLVNTSRIIVQSTEIKA